MAGFDRPPPCSLKETNMIQFARILASMMAFASISGMATVAQAGNLPEICGDCRPQPVATCTGFLEGPTVAPDGALWVTDVIGGNVFKVEPSGQCTPKVKTGGHPNSAKFRSDGKLLIADWQGLLLFDPATGSISNLPLDYKGEKIGDLNDLVIDPAGGVYFTTPGKSSLANSTGRVFYRSPTGEVRLIGQNLAYPNGIALSADGEAVLVSEFAAKRIISYPSVTAKSPFATTYVFALTSGGVGVDGMTVDEKGNLFGANLAAGEVLVYDRKAKLLGEIALPDDAGLLITNIALAKDRLYIIDAQKSQIWQVPRK